MSEIRFMDVEPREVDTCSWCWTASLMYAEKQETESHIIYRCGFCHCRTGYIKPTTPLQEAEQALRELDDFRNYHTTKEIN